VSSVRRTGRKFLAHPDSSCQCDARIQVTFALPRQVHDLLSLPVRRTGTQSPCMPRLARPVRRTGPNLLSCHPCVAPARRDGVCEKIAAGATHGFSHLRTAQTRPRFTSATRATHRRPVPHMPRPARPVRRTGPNLLSCHPCVAPAANFSHTPSRRAGATHGFNHLRPAQTRPRFTIATRATHRHSVSLHATSRQAGASHGANSVVLPSVRRTGCNFLAHPVSSRRCDARIQSPSPCPNTSTTYYRYPCDAPALSLPACHVPPGRCVARGHNRCQYRNRTNDA
jgi:hypothetical protein